MMDSSTAVILEGPGRIAVRRIQIPPVPGPAVRVRLGACGICGSDVRYYQGQNPWSLHTLGKNLPSPPNMVLGHEVAGTVDDGDRSRRVAILAFKACGSCAYCITGRENLCESMEHFGHSAGWGAMAHYPGGMSEQFDIWQGFEYDIPEAISFEEATFLDGLAVAIHAVKQCHVGPGKRVAIIGLGPIGLLAAQVAAVRGAALIAGCDTSSLPVELASRVGLPGMTHGDTTELERSVMRESERFDAVIDTVGTEETILAALGMLDKSGTVALLAVHEHRVAIPPVALSGERQITTSANNRYEEFPEAIGLLASGRVRVKPLITHRYPLAEAAKAFAVMLEKEKNRAYKVVLHP